LSILHDGKAIKYQQFFPNKFSFFLHNAVIFCRMNLFYKSFFSKKGLGKEDSPVIFTLGIVPSAQEARS